MCQVSHVTCHKLYFFYYYYNFFSFLQIGGAIRWRVCYQQGLPRLVSNRKRENKYILHCATQDMKATNVKCPGVVINDPQL